ncbi:endonuclease IV [Faustovirus]|nr:endonuclease IV [Faustovirus]AMP44062.1 endonuclease IV [Faustovirus]
MYGYHVAKGKSMANSIKTAVLTARKDGFWMQSAQIFVAGPQSYNQILNDDDKREVKQVIDELGIQVVAHGAYCDHPWRKNIAGIDNIKRELASCAAIGANGLVVHLGAGAAIDENLEFALWRIADGMTETNKPVLYFEINSAKPKADTFETPAKVTALFQRIAVVNAKLPVPLKYGVCVDTCHLFACGYDDTTYAKMRAYLDAIDALRIPTIIHFNDADNKLGDGRDRHEAIGVGNIWRDYHPRTGTKPFVESGAWAVIEWSQKPSFDPAYPRIVILERDDEGLANDFDVVGRYITANNA